MAAYYEIRRKCGHTDHIKVDNNLSQEELDKRIEEEEEVSCEACQQKFGDKSTLAKTLEARLEKEYGIFLPELTGTEKQIGWARQIRYGILNYYLEFLHKELGESKHLDYLNSIDMNFFNYSTNNYIDILIEYLGGKDHYKHSLNQSDSAYWAIAKDWFAHWKSTQLEKV